jgi:hypothetical protein
VPHLADSLIPSEKIKELSNFYGGVERNFFQVDNASWIADELGFINNVIPGYFNKRWSGNGKLNADFSSLNKKLMLRVVAGANISRGDRRLWVQSYMRENWNRNPQVLEDNDQIYGKVTHQVSSKVFYEVQFNYFNTQATQQDPDFKENLFWWRSCTCQGYINSRLKSRVLTTTVCLHWMEG